MPSRKQRTPARERAYTYVQQLLRALQPGDRLPGTRQLALSAGVSPVTMLHALHALRDCGALSMRARSGARKARHVSARETGNSTHNSSDATSQRLARDILAGHLAAGADLPSMKTLRARYCVSRSTVLRALRLLARDGWLEGAGRWWRTADLKPRKPNATILLLARDATGGAPDFPRAHDHVRYLQRECAAAGVHLRLMRLGPAGALPREAVTVVKNPTAAHTVLGVLVWSLNVGPVALSRTLADCASLPVPVGVLHEVGEDVPISHRGAGRRVRTFLTAADEPSGYTVGRMLAALGHTRVAYLSDRHNKAHSQKRYEGLCRALADAGAGPAVPFVADDARRAEFRRSLEQRLSMDLRDGDDLAAEPLGRMPGLIEPALHQLARYQAFHPLVEACILEPAITAWVAHNDLLACYCVETLSRRGIDVPGRISVVGFDDRPDALGYDLTSYDFGGQAAVHAALLYLLRPDTMRNVGPVYEAPGHLVVRGSTGQAW